ncbi:TnsD family Tn7-like transposition protein, partial [Desulfofalx alkaliphila]|uniref:TnsD family Tn7-like transposition protein n=1 Tax=Desulfofalx alkaliphila TaxID=105483 RepID=UPI0012FF186B
LILGMLCGDSFFFATMEFYAAILGTFILPKTLQNSTVLISAVNKHEYVYASEENCILKESTEIQYQLLEKHLVLARGAKYLLNNTVDQRPLEWFQKQYLNRLISRGMANVNGRVQQEKLITEFVNYYGEEFLNNVNSMVSNNYEFNWLSSLVRKPRKSMHPIRHLLLTEFLGMTIDELFKEEYQYKPFGEGPWLCLNAGAEHYKQPVITDLKIRYDSKKKKPIGTFKCSCGFVYARQGPDMVKEDRYKIGRIKEFGKVWETKLGELIIQNLSLREIAKRLNVDPMTVKKYANKLGLIMVTQEATRIPPVEIRDTKNKPIENVRATNREKWLELIGNYPDKSKTELRQLNKGLYAWLYRNDKKWLNINSPSKKPALVENNRVNWGERDKEILLKVKETVEEMLSYEGKPERITVSRVGKKIGKLGLLEKHLNKLPQTKEFFGNYVENLQDFRTRKINWAIKELIAEGKELKEWRIVRKARLRLNTHRS